MNQSALFLLLSQSFSKPELKHHAKGNISTGNILIKNLFLPKEDNRIPQNPAFIIPPRLQAPPGYNLPGYKPPVIRPPDISPLKTPYEVVSAQGYKRDFTVCMN